MNLLGFPVFEQSDNVLLTRENLKRVSGGLLLPGQRSAKPIRSNLQTANKNNLLQAQTDRRLTIENKAASTLG